MHPASEDPAVHGHSSSGDGVWDEYVLAHPRATFFHQIGWKRVLEAAFPYRAHYLAALRGTRLCGVLPLFRCRSISGRLGLYSLPHTVYGGPVADDGAAEEALLRAARELAGELRAKTLEFRNRHPTSLSLEPLEGFVTFEKQLPATPEAVYSSLPKKAREAVNQATKRHKLEADFDGDLDTFYELLAASFLRLGTPVFPKRLFAALLREFPEATNLLLVRHQGAPVAAVLSTIFRGTMMPLYSGEAPGVADLKTGNYKYFRLMQHAVETGLTRFDFGRSRADNAGVVRFKTNQGFEAEALPYQLDAPAGRGAGRADPNKGLFLRARGIWRRLPARLAKVLGPKLLTYFP